MYFKFQGKKIYYTSIGKGQPVIFIHAFGLDHRSYIDFFENFDGIGRFILFDLPGIGASEALEVYNMSILSQLVYELINELDFKKVTIIGHSLGGYIGAELLSTHPDRIESLIMMNSFCGPDSEQKKEDRQKNIEFIEKYGVALYAKELISNLFSEEFKLTNKYFMDTQMFHSSQYSSAGMCGLVKAMKDRVDHTDTFKSAKAPIGFILGAEDTVIPNEASLLQVTYPTFSTVFFPQNARHMAPFEAESQTKAAITRLLTDK